MIRALLAWFTPTRIYEPTGAELVHALRRSGYRGTMLPWLLSEEYSLAVNRDIVRRAGVACKSLAR